MILRKNEFGPLSEIELEDFEIENDIKLPDDYKTFLLNFNGGKPDPNTVDQHDIVISYLLGMHNGEYYASIYKHINMFQNRIPFETFPIATDPFGNLLIMSLNNESHGQIYFWDHEGEPEQRDGHYTANCSFVAQSFTELISRLKHV